MDKSDIEYSFNPEGVDAVIDEISPTSFLALREVRWMDGDTYKLDLRRYFVKQDGVEMPGKGTAIGNPGKLTEVLIDQLYGQTDTIISSLTQRDDYMSSMGRVYAGYEDTAYESFKDELDAERSKAIIDRGMDSESFMENLK